MNIYELPNQEVTTLNADSSKASQPDSIKIPLKYHQLSLIDYCDSLENTIKKPIHIVDGEYEYDITTKMGIIGDMVGSGKTLSILGLIASTKHINRNLHFENNRMIADLCQIKCVKKPKNTSLNISFIVVPHTIFKQWDTTIKSYTDLACININTSKTLGVFSEIVREIHSTNIYEYDIVLISSTFFNRVINLWNSVKYQDYFIKRIVFDEADTIKLPRCLYIQNNFIWFISSTYKTLLNPNGKRYWQNSAGEISEDYSYNQGFVYRIYLNGLPHRGLIYSCMNSFLDIDFNYINIKKHFIVKNDDTYVSQAFNLTPPNETIIKCKTPLSLKVLSSSASQEIIQHINAGDISGAVEKLDCDRVTEKDLIDAVTKDLKSKIENRYIELEMKSKMNWSSEEQKKESLDKIKEKIRDLENKIDNIKQKLVESHHCNICFDDIIVCKSIAPCCNTKFCFECITKWLAENNKTSCPFCRSTMSLNSLIIVDEMASQSNKNEKEELLSKIDMLKKLLTDRINSGEQHKILIFSDYTRTFDKLGLVLDELDIKYTSVVGTTSSINKKIQLYKSNDSDSLDCLLLNADYCASGLNLENTTDIIITHKMSNEKTQQIIGRGQRPGRKNTLNIWKLFYETEI